MFLFIGSKKMCFEYSCYEFTTSGKSWTENRETCQGKGGDLVSMENGEEWEFVNDVIQTMLIPRPHEWHIGLRKVHGVWQWVNGSPLTLSKWQSGEPSGDGDVTVMSKDYPPGTQGLFNDLPDDYPQAFICEIPTGKKRRCIQYLKELGHGLFNSKNSVNYSSSSFVTSFNLFQF